MPLIQGKSDKSRSENIATEVKKGKSPEQAAAIAYSIQREHQGDDYQPMAVSVMPEEVSVAELNRINRKYWEHK